MERIGAKPIKCLLHFIYLPFQLNSFIKCNQNLIYRETSPTSPYPLPCPPQVIIIVVSVPGLVLRLPLGLSYTCNRRKINAQSGRSQLSLCHAHRPLSPCLQYAPYPNLAKCSKLSCSSRQHTLQQGILAIHIYEQEKERKKIYRV